MTYDTPTDDADPDEQLRQQLHEWIDDAFDADNGIVEHDASQDSTPIHSSTHGHIGREVGPLVHDILVGGPELHLHITVEDTSSRATHVFESDDSDEDETHVYANPEDPNPDCPECDRRFGTDEWTKTAVGGDAWGGQANYDCPTDGCDGEVRYQY